MKTATDIQQLKPRKTRAQRIAGSGFLPAHHEPRITNHESRKAFSLLELLVVLGIVGVLAAIALPNLNSFKPNIGASAGRQLLADVNHARQLALSQHTTVFMVFVPSNIVNDPLGSGSPAYWNSLAPNEQPKATNVLQMQLTGYNYVELRSLGDQPGHPVPHYLGNWKSLPDGAYIPPTKFYNPQFSTTNITDFTSLTNYVGGVPYLLTQHVAQFATNNNIPFPSEFATGIQGPNGTTNYTTLPYIAFNYLGQLVNGQGQNARGSNEFIPLVKGNVIYNHDANGRLVAGNPPTPPTAVEKPTVGNWTNAYNVVEIDWLTGRARLHTPPLQ